MHNKDEDAGEERRRRIFRSEWRRFSDYEIINGWIKPRDGARLSVYDPWNGYYLQRFSKTTGHTPWQALYRIGHMASEHFVDGEDACSDQVKELILQFCREYGLLGILLHQVHRIVLPPHYSSVSDLLANEWQKQGMTYDEAYAKRWISTNYERNSFGGWSQVRHIPGEAAEILPKDLPMPGVLLQPALDKPQLKVEVIRATWAKYFPSIATTDWETYQTPIPSSDEFWFLYAEPEHVFILTAISVFELCHGLREDKTKSRADIVDLLERLSTVTASIRPVYQYINREYRQIWKSHSLYATLVMMLGTDLAGHYRLLSCEACGYIFPTTHYQAKYCDPKCKDVARKRSVKCA